MGIVKLYEAIYEFFIYFNLGFGSQVKMNKAKTKTSKQSPSQNASGNCAVSSRSTPPSRNKSERDVPYEGIYQNLRFCETITSLMGNTVQVNVLMLISIIIVTRSFFIIQQIQLSNGKIFEGIFSTFSPQLEVVLELVHTVDPNQPDKIDVKTVSKEVVFGSQLIVTMSSKDVELDYATKGMSFLKTPFISAKSLMYSQFFHRYVCY